MLLNLKPISLSPIVIFVHIMQIWHVITELAHFFETDSVVYKSAQKVKMQYVHLTSHAEYVLSFGLENCWRNSEFVQNIDPKCKVGRKEPFQFLKTKIAPDVPTIWKYTPIFIQAWPFCRYTSETEEPLWGHYNLQGHSSLTPIYLFIKSMTCNASSTQNSSLQLDTDYGAQ